MSGPFCRSRAGRCGVFSPCPAAGRQARAHARNQHSDVSGGGRGGQFYSGVLRYIEPTNTAFWVWTDSDLTGQSQVSRVTLTGRGTYRANGKPGPQHLFHQVDAGRGMTMAESAGHPKKRPNGENRRIEALGPSRCWPGVYRSRFYPGRRARPAFRQGEITRVMGPAKPYASPGPVSTRYTSLGNYRTVTAFRRRRRRKQKSRLGATRCFAMAEAWGRIGREVVFWRRRPARVSDGLKRGTRGLGFAGSCRSAALADDRRRTSAGKKNPMRGGSCRFRPRWGGSAGGLALKYEITVRRPTCESRLRAERGSDESPGPGMNGVRGVPSPALQRRRPESMLGSR